MAIVPSYVPRWARGMVAAHTGDAWYCVGCNTPYETPATVPCRVCRFSGRSPAPVPDPPARRSLSVTT